MSQKRIEFIDLAKGVCIILVVIGHCGAPINIPGFEIVRMPLYFILSGLFFKDYGGGYNFFIRKTKANCCTEERGTNRQEKPIHR